MSERLATFLSTEFLPLQQDGGLWKTKDADLTAIHYLKRQSERIDSLEREIRNLTDQLEEFQ